jgi:hypothetical protein
MQLTIPRTTSASGTSPRHCFQMARGKAVERPPTRWIVRLPSRSRRSHPSQPQAIRRSVARV